MAKIAEVQEVSLKKIRPYERNAKKHDAEQVEKIAESIKEFGFISPCLIDADFNLIAGHGRLMAAMKLGLESVPCVFVEGLSESQRRAYILADNRIGELATWDMDLVFDELNDLLGSGFDVEITGFEIPEIDDGIASEGYALIADDEEDEFSEVEKLEKYYGVPYQGNKTRIADRIISLLPEGGALRRPVWRRRSNDSLRDAERKMVGFPV